MRSLLDAGAVVAFGTDAPVEPIDPWPGLSMAVTRVDGSWPAGSEPFGPDERLTLEQAIRAACVAPAVDRRRAGSRPAGAGPAGGPRRAAGAGAVEPGRAGRRLATARPRLVMIDGEVAFER